MLHHIFKNSPSNSFIETSSGVFNRRYHGSISSDSFKATIADAMNSADKYFAPALRKRTGSEREDVLCSSVLWADVDDKEQIPQATFPPTFIVRSGGGFHLYWLLSEYCYDVTVLEEHNKTLMTDVGGDHCWNANRILRIPGSTNSKRNNTSVILVLDKPERVYQLSDFDVLNKLDSKARHKLRTGDSRGFKSRSERDWRIVESLVAAGATDEFIHRIIPASHSGDKVREEGVDYLTHTIKQVREKSVVVKNTRRAIGDVVVQDDCYYIEKNRGRFKISTFVLRPTLLLENELEDVIVCDVQSNGYVWPNEQFPRSAFNDRRALDKHLRTSAWVWLGRDDDVRALLPMLLKQLQEDGLPKTKATTVLGRHEGLFVGNEQTLSSEKVYQGMDAPMAFLNRKREIPQLLFTEATAPSLHHLPEINKPEVIWPVLGWFMATPYKPELEKMGVRFPILNIYGTRGSGKTTVVHTFQRLLGYSKPTTYDCNTTRFSTLVLLGSTNAVPVALSEYRQTVAERVNRFVLLSYDTGHDPRGRPDQTTVDYPLQAPFSVDGEDLIADPACKERVIAVGFTPETVSEGSECYLAFQELAKIKEELRHFALSYIQHTLQADLRKLHEYAHKDVWEAFPQVLPDRVRNNLIVARLGQISFCEHTRQELPSASVLEGALNSVWSSKMGRATALVDEFVEVIVNTVRSTHSFPPFFYKVIDGVLWFQLATSFNWWLRSRRMANQSSLDRDAIRIQLTEREGTSKGQYTLAPKVVDGVWCYGVDLLRAFDSGLDIPSNLNQRKLEINI